MDQEGVETKPIQLISGVSPFCETFFNDARAEKTDLLGDLNDGWSVVKRLLQHERQSQTQAGSGGGGGNKKTITDMAREYVGVDESGALVDSDLRSRLVDHLMDGKAHSLTVTRITAEAKGNVEVSAAASILKNSATRISQTKAELSLEMMGSQGIGWEGDHYSSEELKRSVIGFGVKRYPFTVDLTRFKTTSFQRTYSAYPRLHNRGNRSMAALTEEQSMIRDQAKSWVSEQAPVNSFRKMRDDRVPHAFVPSTWTAMVDMGWTGIVVPEQYGGSDLGYLTFGVVLYEIGRQLTASHLFTSSLVGASALVIGGSEVQKQQYLPKIVDGSSIFTFAIDEGPRHNPRDLKSTVTKDGSGYLLSGDKTFVLEGT